MTGPVPTPLDPDKIKANLKTKRIGRKILVYSNTSSTNDIAAEYAKNKKNDGLVIFTEEQTAGRGRGGNKWFSGKSDSILCSLILADTDLNPELACLTIAVATAETLGRLGDNPARIKWPNDILVNKRKIAGILLESKKYDTHTAYVVGIGINCHQEKDSFPVELKAAATSIDIESRTICDRISLSRRLLSSIDHWLEVAGKNSKKVIKQWCKLSIQLGHRVVLVFNGQEFAGNCIGVSAEKGLIVQLDGGGVRMFDAAFTRIIE